MFGEVAPALLALKGCGALSAAKIVGETAGISRFKSRAAFARWNGQHRSRYGAAARTSGLTVAATAKSMLLFTASP